MIFLTTIINLTILLITLIMLIWSQVDADRQTSVCNTSDLNSLVSFSSLSKISHLITVSWWEMSQVLGNISNNHYVYVGGLPSWYLAKLKVSQSSDFLFLLCWAHIWPRCIIIYFYWAFVLLSKLSSLLAASYLAKLNVIQRRRKCVRLFADRRNCFQIWEMSSLLQYARRVVHFCKTSLSS